MGACLSCALFVMLPGVRCNIRRLQNQFAFHPPQPSYEIGADGAVRLFDGGRADSLMAGVSLRTAFVTSAHGNRVCIFDFRTEGATVTLLWSHGNAMDCGECVELLTAIAFHCGVNIATYDYAGYGASSGAPSEAGSYADIACVHAYLAHHGVADDKLVLCGQSVGSGPSLWLAERCPGTRGLFLMSGLTSGLRVLAPAPCFSVAGFCGPPFVFACCDIYPNHRRLRRVRCPVLIMHGEEDEVIHVSHSIRLHEVCPAHARRPPHLVPGAGHNDVVEVNPAAFFRAVSDFLRSLDAPAT